MSNKILSDYYGRDITWLNNILKILFVTASIIPNCFNCGAVPKPFYLGFEFLLTCKEKLTFSM